MDGTLALSPSKKSLSLVRGFLICKRNIKLNKCKPHSSDEKCGCLKYYLRV
jgi:hypothetical protein